jgi:hypothetical protein
MTKYKAEITFVIEIEAENEKEAAEILWEWNPFRPDTDWSTRERITPDNVEFDEIN